MKIGVTMFATDYAIPSLHELASISAGIRR
jgi:hypothetical protein